MPALTMATPYDSEIPRSWFAHGRLSSAAGDHLRKRLQIVEPLIVYGEQNGDGLFVATVVGDLDPATATEFTRQCRSLNRQIDVFDLRFVPFITAAGVSALLELTQRRRCRVVASKIVAQVFDATGMDAMFDIETPTEPPQMDRAPFGVAVHDSSLRFVYVNQAMSIINGADEGSHADRRPEELFDDDSGLDDVRSVLSDVLTTGRGRDVLVGGKTPTGPSGTWMCSIRRSRYGHGVDTDRVVIALVSPLDASDRPSTHQTARSLAS